MPLDKCPHMSARCPHKVAACHDPKSRDCFHIINATTSAISTIGLLEKKDSSKLSKVLKERLDAAKNLLESLK